MAASMLASCSSKAYLCAPFFSPLPHRSLFTNTCVMTSVQDLGKCSASRGASYAIFLLKMLPTVFEVAENKA